MIKEKNLNNIISNYRFNSYQYFTGNKLVEVTEKISVLF